MDFSESTKLEALRLAGFKCCVCGDNTSVISVEVHHIIPQKDSGPSDLDNAIALCPNHHEEFGANSGKRKRLKEIRKYWYGVIENKYSSSDSRLLKEISNHFMDLNKALPDLKKDLHKITDLLIQRTTAENARTTVSSIVGSLTSISASASPSPSPEPPINLDEIDPSIAHFDE